MTNTSEARLAVLVHACDRYEFLYKGFGYFFSRHWDHNIPANYYFATEEIPAAVPGFTNIRSGTGEWSDRLRKLLTESIKEEYVLYFQEDMWLTRDVSPAFFRQLLEMTIANNWNQVKLHSGDIYKTTPTDIFIEGFNLSVLDNAASEFLMSHQVTLWKKDFLVAQLPPNEHPWRNERKATKRMKQLDPLIHQMDYFRENARPMVNKNKPGAVQAEYYTISHNGMLGDSITLYIDRLQSGDAKQQQYAHALQHHYEHRLTHDGKERPRKDDIFKKIKNWIKGTGN